MAWVDEDREEKPLTLETLREYTPREEELWASLRCSLLGEFNVFSSCQDKKIICTMAPASLALLSRKTSRVVPGAAP